MITNSKTNFTILIIDNSKEFNNQLSHKMKEFGYRVFQAASKEDTLKHFSLQKDKFDLIVLNIENDATLNSEVFSYLKQSPSTKIVLLSENDDVNKRESYFKQGILDYHLSSKKLDYIADDINDVIKTIETNTQETILIIDDSKLICKVMQNLLEKRSYKVYTAQTAKEGLEILRQNEITLLILDMELPDTHGLEVLELLRDMYMLNNFLVLVVSSTQNPSIIRDVLKKGASNFLHKPFLYEELLLKVDLLVKASRSRKTITHQKEQIENSLRGFKELVNSSINAMFIFQKNLCVDCNNEAIELLELGTKKDLIGKNIVEVFQDVSSEHKEELLDDTIDHYFEDKVLSRTGKVYDVQIKERNISIGTKHLKIVAAMDITDLKRNNKIISQQSKMASMGEMIGNIAHQWRQPLTAISVAASGIKLNYELDMEDKEETMSELDNIVKNTQFLSSTIEDFQNFLKNDRSKSQFFIKDTLKKTLAIIQANIESHEIEIEQIYHDDFQIEGIQNDLVQIFLNVINNAVDILKQQEKGKQRNILIEVTFKDQFHYVTIKDSGGGVPENIIDKIFDPYFTTKHQAQGTGLGLYMTHQITEKIGGAIDVMNSEFNMNGEKYYGANFTIKVPSIFIN